MSQLSDYGDEDGGYCATTFLDDGTEVTLSQCMKNGTQGVADTITSMCEQMQTIPTIAIQWMALQRGIKMELRGIRMTAKAPPCTSIIKERYGVKKGMSKLKTQACWDMLLNLAYTMAGEEE